MSRNKRWIALGFIFVSAIFFIGIRVGLYYRALYKSAINYARISVSPEDEPLLQIKPCKADNTDSETIFLFLPDSKRRYTWKIPSDIRLFIDGEQCNTGEILVDSMKEEEHLFAIEKDGEFKDVRNIIYIYADNIPAIAAYVNEDELEIIEDEGVPMAKASARMVIMEGDKTESLSCEFGGHGSSSWEMGWKRSYEFECLSPLSLLGMGKYAKWNLISNNMDRSLVKNRIVYEAAASTDYEFSIRCEYVNYYLNGVYQGLYLLTEKPNVNGGEIAFSDDLEAENELLDPRILYRSITNDETERDSYRYYDIGKSPPNISGSYLMEFDGWYDEPDAWFRTSTIAISGEPYYVMLKEPRFASKKELLYIRDYVRETEDALYSENGIDTNTGIDFRDRMDCYSWAMSYLFMDFFGYQDASGGSLFFYKKRDDPKLYSGPIWDYDKSMTDDFYESDFSWNDRASLYLWYERMGQFEDIHRMIEDNYKKELSPAMEEILRNKLPAWMEEMSSSARMDDIRYNRGNEYAMDHAKLVQEWLTLRKELFDSVWIRGEDSPYAENIF